MRNVLIQKFGGSSLDTPEKRELVVDKIINSINQGYKPVVVVSAMGREGSPYATDTLINLAKEAYGYINPRDKDLLMSCGEVISTVVVGQKLKSRGYDYQALTGAQAGIVTDDNHGSTKILEVNPGRILEALENNFTPIVAGFQGITEEGEITTLGRGGSDTTACVLGAALHAEMVEIYTDVEGVMTADPDLVPDAKTLKHITYTEVGELAYQGAKVIHPRAAEIAKRERVPVMIKSTFSDAAGTVISDKFKNSDEMDIKGDQLVAGVASRTNVSLVKIIPREEKEFATDLGCFEVLAEAGISVDFINVRPEMVTFIINNELIEKTEEVLAETEYNYEIGNNLIKISVVGAGMTGQPGVMSKVVKALEGDGVSIYQTTDSHTTISCLIREDEEKKALCALHEQFNLAE
ncbi:aspartate kinase [Acetohalobium arabaticum]|uniref:Aspartokinase n=1 Tax=Acetohalobium arabaticum (strain ATCC 49924 / DSM 5501 / Z-7288) TaxID=574087 RepID=D9QRE1_ACEAZ|nr:aspartate kinase [Acetohalobium arabaticum]ADL13082.1 aspartate kinase [Acetohalobium arabaticum DSM 5501]